MKLGVEGLTIKMNDIYSSLQMLLECIYLGVGTAVKAQLLDDLLHSFPSLFPGHVGRQAKGSRKVQVFTHCQCSHHNIILNVSRTNDNYASEKYIIIAV